MFNEVLPEMDTHNGQETFDIGTQSRHSTWLGTYPFNLLTLLHRLRISKLKEYAARHGLMVIICANRTEGMLGYFVEKGIDDPEMGDYAPISGLYKCQVICTARFLGFTKSG